MGQTVTKDRYPQFVADQVLTEKSLNQMFGYLEEQQRLTRSTLIGIGILCGLNVRVNDAGTALTITAGVGVTSKGYLVPFPETTYQFYNDEFSAEQEHYYEPFLNDDNEQAFTLNLLHNDEAAEIQKPITPDFLEDKVVVIFVELLKVDNKNCDPDSCDDKGVTIEVTHRPLLIAQEDIHNLIASNENGEPFYHEPACVEWPELRMPRYNVDSTFLLNSPVVLHNFLKVLDTDFLQELEQTLSAAYSSLGMFIQDDFPTNPFSGLRNDYLFLNNGGITAEQLLHAQYYYDFFSDLILAYEELRQLCNTCLTVCSPNEELFPRHLILGNAIAPPVGFRHQWIASPAVTSGCCSEGRLRFLLRKIALLIQKVSIPRAVENTTNQRNGIRITPSNYGTYTLSEKAIPYYYNITNGPDELYMHWNFKRSRLKNPSANLSYDSPDYGLKPIYTEPLNYDLEPYNFFRIEGHIGLNWKEAIAQISSLKREKRLPIDVIALNGDIFALIQSLLSDANNLNDILSADNNAFGQLWCYFADLERQYDVHAAELRCAITKAMAFFYNLPTGQSTNTTQSGQIPVSELIRLGYPDYRTKPNTFGALFDEQYPGLSDGTYFTAASFMTLSGYATGAAAARTDYSGIVIALMYYLEKIHEALPAGLVFLNLKTLSRRINDAVQLATQVMINFDLLGQDLPASLEETLDAIIRICKAKVFEVIYRNFLINYVLFTANQTFAYFAFKHPGIEHKAGVERGGTFILVYTDKPEIRELIGTAKGIVANANGEAVPGVYVVQKGSSKGVITDAKGRYTLSVTGRTPELILSKPGMKTIAYATDREDDARVTMPEAEIHATDSAYASYDDYRYGKKKKRSPFDELRINDDSIQAQGVKELTDLIDEVERDQQEDIDLRELVNTFPEGTVIADFFVPGLCRSACMSMNFIVADGWERPDDTDTDDDSDQGPVVKSAMDWPMINLRWGLDRRSFTTMLRREVSNNVWSSTPPRERRITGEVNLMEIRFVGEDKTWLDHNPVLHLLRYKPKKRGTEQALAGFRKEADVTANYYGRVTEFSVDSDVVKVDIRPERYFTVGASGNGILPMGLSSPSHKMYFYTVLSLEKDGQILYGEPSKVFRITISEGNHFSFHID